jgi:enoyl-CoA hydratase
MLTGLRSALREADADAGVDVVILTGTDPAFCLGDDGADMLAPDPDVRREITEAIFRSPRVWEPNAKPVIGAINGATERGGLEIAMQCDFLIASERASFADVHVRDGVVPAWALTVTLPAAVGRARAIRMCLTGRSIDANEALAIGLVTKVVPHDRLLEVALGVADDISAKDSAAVRSLLATLRAAAPLADAAALRREFEAHRSLLESTGRFSAVLDVLRDIDGGAT